ncbi:MAG: Asp23/Gls24 family envelope stress response protein [Dermatophilaceae bacterium]
MADPAPEADLVAERGRTVIEDRVVQRLAQQASLEVPGVVPDGSGLDKIVGRALPEVSVTVAGHRTRISVEVAAVWPAPLADLAAAVRQHVAETVQVLTELDVDAVDVEVARLVRGPQPPERRTR